MYCEKVLDIFLATLFQSVQKLQTAMARQDNLEKKGGAKLPPSMQLENARVENLEMQNKNLQAKVKVLKQQLMNHSFIHTKENKIAENKEKNYKNPEYFRDVGQTQSARDSKHRYNSPSPSARDLNNVSALKERIAMLENMLETQKDKYKTRIAQLEKEVAAMGKSGNNLNEELNEHSRKVSDNVEIIKLRRDGKKLSKDIDILNDQNDALRKELEELKVALKKANESVAELERILEREREKARDAESNLSKSMSNTETIRALQEEIRDLKQRRAWLLLGWVTTERFCPCKQPTCPAFGDGLEVNFKPGPQNERKELKEANEQLLLLTTTPPKSDRSGSESKLKQQSARKAQHSALCGDVTPTQLKVTTRHVICMS
ncbi:hypothetical protein J6590_095171 [Homalodisca vitripennis]|nr:hypothetical protein J6590_095171 [Homalodisca vitripennis]